MIVVDNFRTVLLVGLICTVWISPSFADNMCAGAAAPCTADDIYCHITIEGAVNGCTKDECPATVPDAGAGFACDAAKGCCCTAGAEPCNDMNKPDIKMKACEDALLKDKAACKPTDTTGSSVSSSEGPTSAGGPSPTTGGNKCTIKISADNSTDVGPCEKACQTKTDGSEFKCVDMCEKDECGDTTCCCKSETDVCTITLSTGNSLASLGSLQVVTLVAAALYFFPVKTSS